MFNRLASIAFGLAIGVTLIVGYNWYPVTPTAAPKTARLQQDNVQTAFLQTRFGN
jgi:hypothetical protein